MNIKTICGGSIGTNSYIVEGLIFDYIPETLSYIKQNNIQPKALFITHIHFDHIEGLQDFINTFPEVPVYASAEAKKNINNPEYTLMYGDNIDVQRITAVSDRTQLDIDNHKIITVKTPGHSVDSVSWFAEDLQCVFCGDLVFYRSIGRTDFIGGDLARLSQSVETLFSLVADDKTVLYPGHGPSTTIGEEKRFNPYL
jgi:glyoxylase-like metal-dependent hydrolase (beta-lactamase superfamily II)